MAVKLKGSREDQYNVTVAIDAPDPKNNINLGTFDKMSGGDQDSEETKYRPGNMGDEISLGGNRMVSNITVSRIYDLARDHNDVKKILALVGVGNVTVTKQPLDVGKNPFGSPIVYTGTLKSVKLPDHDSTSSSPGMLELEISAAGTIG